MSRVMILLAALSLSACATHGTRPTPELSLHPQLPPNATLPCADLPVVSEGAGLQEFVINHVEVAGLYHECKAKQQALIHALEIKP